MIEISIVPEDETLANLLSSLEMISSKFMPKTYKAVKVASAVAEYTWKSYALGAPIPGTSMRIKTPNGDYARSIKSKHLSPFHIYVYSDSDHAKSIEDGTTAVDLKKILPFSARSRVSKAGKGYNIVPFRHGIPGSLMRSVMPKELYDKLRAEIRSGKIEVSRRIKGGSVSANYKGELVKRANYQWGTRITTGIKNMEGMVVMDTSSTSSTRSTYLTFRVISENSPSFKWIIPGRPGMKITRFVAQNTQEIIKEIIQQGISEDLGIKV